MFSFIYADLNDPDEDPAFIFLYSAQNGSIEDMEKAMIKDPSVLLKCDSTWRVSALHRAAGCFKPKAAVNAVRWLLKKGIPWDVTDAQGLLPEDWACMHKNEESQMVLRNWAIESGDEYVRLVYLNPHGAPEDEVALVVGDNGTGVMMEWERPIMRETARLLLYGMPTTGLRVLNIGFGIGMIDTYFQDAQPAEHVIIEGHPTCLEWMRHKGWYDRPGVRVLGGRWQDYFPLASKSAEADSNQTSNDGHGQQPTKDYMVDIGKFDIVYFDTFEEGYRGHFAFIQNVPGLLRGPGSRFSYFNGHGARGEVSQQIYMEIARLHHNDLGMNIEYFPVEIDQETKWYNLKDPTEGVTGREPQYNIPICALAPTIPCWITLNVALKDNCQPEM